MPMLYCYTLITILATSGLYQPILAQTTSETRNCAHIVGATATQNEVTGTWTFSATISSPYEVGWDQYADAWQVRTSDKGDVLGTRELGHPHQNEQPFTRSLSGVMIPDETANVVFAARDLLEGYCGDEFTLELPVTPEDEIVFCFSGASTVQVKGREDDVPMNRLQVGDWVHVGDNQYEPIYSFGHYSPFAIASFLQFKTDIVSSMHHQEESLSSSSVMEISSSHMVFTRSKSQKITAIPASMVQIGDELVLGGSINNNNQTSSAIVTEIASITSQGAFAPFTPSGKLVVNGILVSSYIAMSASLSEYNQWLAHSFQFPHRLTCYYFRNDYSKKETYTPEGLSTWVAAPYTWAQWLMQLHPLLRNVLLVLFSLVMVLFNAVEVVVIRGCGLSRAVGFDVLSN